VAGALESKSTLLLEDVADMPRILQEKLEIALDARAFARNGDSHARPVDVRLVATSRRDPLDSAQGPALSQALYGHLAGVTLYLPPLRERAGEMNRFANRFLAEATVRPGRRPPRLSNDALGALIRKPFPGNLRELRDLMFRAHGLAGAGFVGVEHLVFEPSGAVSPSVVMSSTPTRRFAAIAPTEPPAAPTEEIAAVVVPTIEAARTPAPEAPVIVPVPRTTKDSFREQMEALERERILRVLEECDGSQARAATVLGMTRRALAAQLEYYGLTGRKKR
jgi:DNA-binding NtrC family response regulator